MLGTISMRVALLVAVAIVGGCAMVERRIVHPRIEAKSWCEPKRGAPPDPTLGLASPIRIGIASIVEAQDGATESFAALEQWSKTTWVADRRATVDVIDHPADADYAVSGEITGELGYDRETRVRTVIPAVGYGVGYTVGASLVGTAALIDAVSSQSDTKTVWNIGLLFTGVGLLTHAYVWSRPANEYYWTQVGHFTLRRNGVRIGEFYIPNAGLERSWSSVPDFRDRALDPLWQKARREIAACIAADLGVEG